MKIFISGDGESGTYLAKLLSSENQDIILMGNNDEHLNNLDARYNILTTSGNPLSVKDLKKPESQTPTCLSQSIRGLLSISPPANWRSYAAHAPLWRVSARRN